ncbi:MAG: hypothetical protein RR543_06005 [Erysipelotrichales bacterium]
MQVIFVVLNKVECLDELLARLKKAGIGGGTIVDSTGMVKSLESSDDSYLLGSLRLFLDNSRPDSKTLFFIVNDDQVDLIRKTVDDVLEGIDNHDTGIMFGIPISFADGLIKK